MLTKVIQDFNRENVLTDVTHETYKRKGAN